MNANDTTFDMSNFFGVGKPITKGTIDMDEVLKQTGLDFTISKQQLVTIPECASYTVEEEGKVIRIDEPSEYSGLSFPQKIALVRDDIKDVVAIMGNNYGILQNKECIGTMAAILKESQNQGEAIELVRGGNVRNCERIFIAAKLPMDMEVTTPKGKVIVHKYIVAQWSHTGDYKMSLTFATYCPLLNCFLYTGGSSLEKSIRHSKFAETRLDEAARYLKAAYSSYTKLERQFREFAGVTMTTSECEKFVALLFPMPDADESTAGGKRAITRVENKREDILTTINRNSSQNKFDVFLSVCQYCDHERTVQQKKTQKEAATNEELRFLSSFNGTGMKEKSKTFELLSTWE